MSCLRKLASISEKCWLPATRLRSAAAGAQVKLVDAGFVWTEPHSRRLKVKLTVQAEVMNGAILQQAFVVEFVVEPHMCMDCTRANTNVSVWTACVQVRLVWPLTLLLQGSTM